MNLFLPICRDLFINFECFLFNWKLLQSSGSEHGLIRTWIALDPNKEENKKKEGTVTTREDVIFPHWYCAPANYFSQAPSPGSSFLPPFGSKVLLGTCWWKGFPPQCPRWGLTPQVESVLTDVPRDWGAWWAGGPWRVLHPCVTAGL